MWFIYLCSSLFLSHIVFAQLYVSPTGQDVAAFNCAQANPCRTPAYALSRTLTSQTVFITPGIYQLTGTLQPLGNTRTIRGTGSNPSDVVLVAGASPHFTVTASGIGFTIENLEVRSSAPISLGAQMFINGARQMSVTDVIFSQGGGANTQSLTHIMGNSDVTFNRCEWRENRFPAGVLTSVVRLLGISSTNFSNCSFHDNESNQDIVQVATTGDVNFFGCNFTQNSAASCSTLQMISVATDTVLTNCLFQDNIGQASGAILLSTAGAAHSMSIQQSTFRSNLAISQGGAISMSETAPVSTITNSLFEDNSLIINGEGGAIYNRGTLTLSGTTFLNHHISSDAFPQFTPRGGALWNSGTATVATSTFTNNSVTGSGAAIFNMGTLSLSSTAFSESQGAGTLANDGGTMSVGLGVDLGANLAGADLRVRGGTMTVSTALTNVAGIDVSSGTVSFTNAPALTVEEVIVTTGTLSFGAVVTVTSSLDLISGTLGAGTLTLAAGSESAIRGSSLNTVNGALINNGQLNVIGNGGTCIAMTTGTLTNNGVLTIEDCPFTGSVSSFGTVQIRRSTISQNLQLQPASVVDLELSSIGDPAITVMGTLALNQAQLVFSRVAPFWPAPANVLSLFTTSVSATGSFSQLPPQLTGSVTVTPSGVNFSVATTPLLAEPDIGQTLEEQPVELRILDNDFAQGGQLTVDSTTAGVGGTLVFDPQTQILTFTPSLDFFGTATGEYVVRDLNGVTAVTTVQVTVVGINDAPTASATTTVTVDASQLSAIDAPVALTLAGSDVDGDALTWTITGLPIFGTLELEDGTQINNMRNDNKENTSKNNQKYDNQKYDNQKYDNQKGNQKYENQKDSQKYDNQKDNQKSNAKTTYQTENRKRITTSEGVSLSSPQLFYRLDPERAGEQASLVDTFQYVVSDGQVTTAPLTFVVQVTGVPGASSSSSGTTVATITVTVVLVVCFVFLCVVCSTAFLVVYRKKNKVQVVELPSSIPEIKNVELGQVLGEGQFGLVYKGTWSGVSVALKALKAEDVASSENELSIMNQIKHPNVVQFFGIYNQSQIFMVTEFMNQGDLLHLLQTEGGLATQELASLSAQVASGMAYLHQQSILHRDLAARNIFVSGWGEFLTAKVGDFGLSSKFSEDHTGKALPVRWTAPEVLEFQKFSANADVWSYGVVLWEIFSRGSIPYPGIKNSDILRELKSGFRLTPPTEAPEAFAKVMKNCWLKRPSQRPNFPDIVSFLAANVKLRAQDLSAVEKRKSKSLIVASADPYSLTPSVVEGGGGALKIQYHEARGSMMSEESSTRGSFPYLKGHADDTYNNYVAAIENKNDKNSTKNQNKNHNNNENINNDNNNTSSSKTQSTGQKSDTTPLVSKLNQTALNASSRRTSRSPSPDSARTGSQNLNPTAHQDSDESALHTFPMSLWIEK